MTSSQGGGGGSGGSKYGGPSGSYHRPNYSDPRHHGYRHFTSRPNNDVSFTSDLEPQHFTKRAKLHDSMRQDKLLDSTGKSFMNSSSASTPSGGSGSNSVAGILLTAEPVSPQYGGLSQYISDIESDDDVDVVAQMDKQQQQKPIQQEQPLQQQLVLPPQPLMPPQLPVEEKPIKKLMDEEVVEKKEQPASPVTCKMTKEELLLLMERVDHDIAKVELQVSVLKKKEVRKHKLFCNMHVVCVCARVCVWCVPVYMYTQLPVFCCERTCQFSDNKMILCTFEL